jgi:DNA-binding GntR family transcriptional regulator
MAEAKASQAGSIRASNGRTREAIVRNIIDGLYDGRFEPGQRLQEAQLTAAFGISRGPVREALNALSAMGIVDLTPQRGAQVRVLGIEEAIDTLIVVQTLIGLSARLAATRAPQGSQRDNLVKSLETILAFDAEAGGADYGRARDSFYGSITALASNVELSRVLPTVRIHLIRVQFRSVLREYERRWRGDYRRIADAILAGRPREAESAARTHVGRAIDCLRAFQSS